MTAAGGTPGGAAIGRPATGDFHGRPTRRLTNGAITLEVLAEAGPRLVRLRREGSPANLLAETPDLGWETALGRYEDSALTLRDFLKDHADLPDAARAKRWLDRLEKDGKIRKD